MPDTPDVIVYTDGACSGNPGPGGWAAILKHPATGKVKKLTGGHASTTNNQMELTAAIEGLRAMTTPKRPHPTPDDQIGRELITPLTIMFCPLGSRC